MGGSTHRQKHWRYCIVEPKRVTLRVPEICLKILKDSNDVTIRQSLNNIHFKWKHYCNKGPTSNGWSAKGTIQLGEHSDANVQKCAQILVCRHCCRPCGCGCGRPPLSIVVVVSWCLVPQVCIPHPVCFNQRLATLISVQFVDGLRLGLSAIFEGFFATFKWGPLEKKENRKHYIPVKLMAMNS